MVEELCDSLSSNPLPVVNAKLAFHRRHPHARFFQGACPNFQDTRTEKVFLEFDRPQPRDQFVLGDLLKDLPFSIVSRSEPVILFAR